MRNPCCNFCLAVTGDRLHFADQREFHAAAGAGPGVMQMLSMTTPRALHAAVALHDGRILICGGTSDANIGGVLDERRDLRPDRGNIHTDRLNDRRAPGPYCDACFPHGEVLIAGGQKNIGFRSALASAEIYDPDSGTLSRGRLDVDAARRAIARRCCAMDGC